MESPKYTGLEFLTALKMVKFLRHLWLTPYQWNSLKFPKVKQLIKLPLAKNIEIYKAVYTAAFAPQALDTATGSAAHTLLEHGVGYGTIDLNVK